MPRAASSAKALALRERRARIERRGATRKSLERASADGRADVPGLRLATVEHTRFIVGLQRELNALIREQLGNLIERVGAADVGRTDRLDAVGDEVKAAVGTTRAAILDRIKPERLLIGVAKSGKNVFVSNRKRYAKSGFALLGINDLPPKSEAALLSSWTQENIQLIKGVNEEQLNKLEALFMRSSRDGARASDITSEVSTIMGSSLSRAKLIAYDQIGKLNGQLDRLKQTNIGVTHYIWRSSQDEAVRKTHKKFNGQRYAWESGSPEGHPGQPVRCRCIADPDLDAFLQDIAKPPPIDSKKGALKKKKAALAAAKKKAAEEQKAAEAKKKKAEALAAKKKAEAEAKKKAAAEAKAKAEAEAKAKAAAEAKAKALEEKNAAIAKAAIEKKKKAENKKLLDAGKPPKHLLPIDKTKFEVKTIPGSGIEWHDVHDKATGKKVAFAKKKGVSQMLHVNPPEWLSKKGWLDKAWDPNTPGHADIAYEYARLVGEQIAKQASKNGVPKPSTVQQAVKAAVPKAKPGTSQNAWSKKWKGAHRPVVSGTPESEFKARWSTDEAGAGIATDGNWIEDFSVTYQTEGADLVARFKVNHFREKDFRALMDKAGDVKTKASFSFVGQNGKRVRAPGVDAVRVAKLGRARVSHVLGAKDGGRLAAMHNVVEIRVPKTSTRAKAFEQIQATFKKLGIDATTPDAKAVDAWKRVRLLNYYDRESANMLTHFNGQRDQLDMMWENFANAEMERIAKDITVREVTPGRVAAYSEQLAKEFTEAGVTHLQHDANMDPVDLMDLIFVKDKSNSGLLSSKERYSRGKFTEGMSTSTDFRTGGADSVFVRAQTNAPGTNPQGARVRFEIDPSELGRMDVYAFNSDQYGRAGEANIKSRLTVDMVKGLAKKKGFRHGNEFMFRHGIPKTSIRRVRVAPFERDRVIAHLKNNGVTEVNGVPVEEFVHGG